MFTCKNLLRFAANYVREREKKEYSGERGGGGGGEEYSG